MRTKEMEKDTMGTGNGAEKLRIVMCDDEPVFADLLAAELKRICAEREIGASVFYAQDVKSLEKLLGNGEPDLLLMDICLEECGKSEGTGTEDGIEAIRCLRKRFPELPVIFISSMEDRVLDGYDVRAFGFLYKRNFRERLGGLFDRFLKECIYADVMTVKTGDGIRQIKMADIRWVEADGRHTRLHLQGENLECGEPVVSFAAGLPEAVFTEVYHCVYVHLDHIGTVGKDEILMDNGDKVPLSRRKRKYVLSAVMKRMAE